VVREHEVDGVPRAPLRGRRLAGTWVVVVTLAEVVGFVVPAVVGALTSDARPMVLLTAGAVEGALLGAGQACVLRRALPIPSGLWIVVTSGAAVLAYALGLLPSVTATMWSTWPMSLLVPVAGAEGLALLGTIGTAQWWLLRRHLARAGWWILATALGWLLGLAVFLAVAMPLWRPGQALALTVLIGLSAAVLMAAVMSGVTGLALGRLLPASSPGESRGRRIAHSAVPVAGGNDHGERAATGSTPLRRGDRG
jgi:hypothetical protein